MIAVSGCSAEFCDIVECTDTGGGGSTATGTAGNGVGGSTTTGIPDECDPAMLLAGQSIGDTCGLFVEPGAPTSGAGTKASPFGTLAEALAIATPNVAIYVCATTEALNEGAVLAESVFIVGAMECATWEQSMTKTAWTAPANTVPLRIPTAATNSIIAGFSITAATATDFDAATGQGNASIAALIDGATVTLENVDLVASAGAQGGPGASVPTAAPGRQSDAAAFDGNPGGGCGQLPGDAKFFACSAAPLDLGIGGTGGDGSTTQGFSGFPGLYDPGAGEPNGTAGAGDSGVGSWNCILNSGFGQDGHGGAAGSAGAGGTSNGAVLANAPYYVGTPGMPGMPGKVAQGGGGGGGQMGNGANGCGAGVGGPGGGSGGAGGCGGATPGGGGGPGGASIALVSLDATVTLTNVTLTANFGGTGGQGGDGQPGGTGGLGGLGTGACPGGDGGNGGPAGAGGGGAGGPSFGLAYTGSEPALDDLAIQVAMGAAPGGNGGTGGLMGAMGELAKKKAF